MAQVYKKLQIDVNSRVTDIITAMQKDVASRFLDVVLLDGSVPVDLTGHEVRIYGKKADGTEFYNNGEITEAANGRCQFEITSQMLAAAKDVEVQIVIFYNNEQVLSTQAFVIHVVKSLISDSAIESSNEYGALVVLYQNLYEAYDLMTEMVEKIGVPGEQAQALSLSTMFQVWDWLVEYLQANSSAGVVEAVNGILALLGTDADTSGDTVLGRLKVIESYNKPIKASDTVRKALISSPMAFNSIDSGASKSVRSLVYFAMGSFIVPESGIIRIKITGSTTAAGATSSYKDFSIGFFNERKIYAYGGNTADHFGYPPQRVSYMGTYAAKPPGTYVTRSTAADESSRAFSIANYDSIRYISSTGNINISADYFVEKGDHIILLASQGYDPTVSPTAYMQFTINSINICYDYAEEV